MEEETRLILTAPPTAAREASAYALPIGHMAYRIGCGTQLLRANIPVSLRGGLMVVDDSSFDGRGDCSVFCQQVVRECSVRGFDGVILDFEGSPHPLLGQIVNRLASLTVRRGWPLYVTEQFAEFSPHARVIIPSALSGGSLFQRLSEAVERYGAGRVALGIQRTAEDFTLPSPTGSGRPLTREELARKLQSRGAAIFFSDELCAHYFTYMSHREGAHFVLFDNAASIKKKISIARSMSLAACIFTWSEVDDIIGNIIS